jgi:hypothetical protein
MPFYLQKQGDASPSGTLATFTVATQLPPQPIPGCNISSLFADPAVLPAAGIPATIHANANCAWDLRLNDAAGDLLGSGTGSGTAALSSAADGTRIYLQPQGSTRWQDNLAILNLALISPPSVCSAKVFTVTPINSGNAFGVATISADATCPYDIRVDAPDGALFGSSQGFTSANTGNWVTYGQQYFLQRQGDTSPTGTLATQTAIVLP